MNYRKSKQKLNDTKEWFARLNIFSQLGVVLVMGAVIVIVSGMVTGSIKDSYTVFVDPPSLFIFEDGGAKLLFSFFLMFLGLAVSGFIISVLSSWLENVLSDIKEGRLEYNGEDHTLVINVNEKIFTLLNELNLLYANVHKRHDVVLFCSDIDKIEFLQDEIKNLKFKNINVYARFGNVLSWERYNELSVLNVHSIIILSDENIEDEFIKDNQNLRILNLLCSQSAFMDYLDRKKTMFKPVKSIVEFTHTGYFEQIVSSVSNSHFVAIAPRDVLSNIINLSSIDILFFNIWSELLSFGGYDLYFMDAKKYGIVGNSYKEVLLKHQNGLLIGLSRTVANEFKLLLNAQNEVIQEGDWLIVIANRDKDVSFRSTPLSIDEKIVIEQPKETYRRNLIQIGNERVLKENEWLENGSSLKLIVPQDEELFRKEFFDTWILGSEKVDKIIVNLSDETVYRLAMNLKVFYPDQKDLDMFVFLVDDTLIADQLSNIGIQNAILTNLLFTRYITQVSNQLALHRVFKLLFAKDGAEINHIEKSDLPKNIVDNTDKLKAQLVANDMVYIGAVYENNSIVFEAEDIRNASKIIVLSNGAV